MSIPATLALLTLFVSLPLSWFVTVLLVRMARRSSNPVVRDRAVAAFALSVIVTVFAAIFWNNDQAVPPLSAEATKVITRAAVFAWSLVPTILWLRLYRRSKP